jgi:hypothetical protein
VLADFVAWVLFAFPSALPLISMPAPLTPPPTANVTSWLTMPSAVPVSFPVKPPRGFVHWTEPGATMSGKPSPFMST